MALTVGPITEVGITPNSVQLSVAPGAGGTGPYTYQWYKSFTTGFTPGSAFLIPGATALTLTDTGLLPETPYYYVVKVTDLGNGSATALSAQKTETTPAGTALEINSFQQAPVLGQVDQSYNTNTLSVVLDSSVGATHVLPGTFVKQVAPTGVTAGSRLNTLPHVVPCTADDDEAIGCIQFSMKDQYFVGGSPCEISADQNVQYCMATANGVAGDVAQLDLTAVGGVQSKTGTGPLIVGKFVDTPVIGQLCRVRFQFLPYTFAA